MFCHLVDEVDRVWLRCRETNDFHFVRPVGVVASEYLDRRVYLRSCNALRFPLTLSSVDRQRLALSPLRHNLISHPESVTDTGSDLQMTSHSPRRHSRSQGEEPVVPRGPWMDVLHGMCFISNCIITSHTQGIWLKF